MKAICSIFLAIFVFNSFLPGLLAGQEYLDRTHYSEVFQENRKYRIFLPPDYNEEQFFYPVIYYFHGFNDRYTLELYDGGTYTVPAIASFVSREDVIVVALDGYVAEDYTGFYRGSPWGILQSPGNYDFGPYFLEFVDHIDQEYRTLKGRRYRGTCGLSMGGFMSLYLSARYPDVVGSASSYNPGAEFYVGPAKRLVLWRPKDHPSSHSHSWIRLIRASGDHISQYHQEIRDVYSRAERVRFEYREDEFHKHAVTSISETFDFHMRAFDEPSLDSAPTSWDYTSPFAQFRVWDYEVKAAGAKKALVYLNDVEAAGLRVTTRQWAPDGPPLLERQVQIRTAPLYSPNETYVLLDYNLTTQQTTRRSLRSSSTGRLEFVVDGEGHQLSFSGNGIGQQPPVLLPLTLRDKLYLAPRQEISIPVRLFNPRPEPMRRIGLNLTTEYPTVEILEGNGLLEELDSGSVAEISQPLKIRVTGGGGYFAPASLRLQITYDGTSTVSEWIDVNIIPERLPTPEAFEILDGRTFTFSVFRQEGNQGGGRSIARQVTEGKGDGDGVLEPGEEATIWLKMKQGMDPFDKNNWYRCKIRSKSKWIEEKADLQEQKQREWTGAKYRTSLIRLAPETPVGVLIPLLLENQSWSFFYTPDVRYGEQTLYQAFQFHQHHLHTLDLTVSSP